MKIRSGFVSNSSSSSFIIACDPVKLEDIISRSDCKPNIFMDGQTAIMDGCDFFELTPNMIEEMKQLPHKFENQFFYEVYEKIDSGSTIDVSKLPKRRVTFITIEISYHSTDNLNTFIERYVKNEEDEN